MRTVVGFTTNARDSVLNPGRFNYGDRAVYTRAGDGVRTHDIQLGKLALYQLSYTRVHRDVHIQEPQIGIEPMTARLRIECSTTELLWHDRAHDPKCAVRSTKNALRYFFMPSRGLEPRCLSAQAPQACVSTNFTTRASVTTAPSRPTSDLRSSPNLQSRPVRAGLRACPSSGWHRASILVVLRAGTGARPYEIHVTAKTIYNGADGGRTRDLSSDSRVL
jgi:hypothetical protein